MPEPLQPPPSPYTEDDLPRLVAKVREWTFHGGACGYCHIGDLTQRIYEHLASGPPSGDLVHVWDDGGTIWGIGLNARFDRAFELFVSPVYRGHALEREMLGVAIDTTRRIMDDAGIEGPVITDVFACDRTRIVQLTRLGFERYRIWDYLVQRDLLDDIPEAPLAAGFTIRSAKMDDAEQLALARNSAFGSTWSATSYRDGVMTKPGYRVENEVVVVAPDDRIAAFTVIWPDESNGVGLFEPVGTHRDFQRRGLARAVLADGLRRMGQLGVRSAAVHYDATNRAAHRLYAGLGFTKHGETLGYRQA